jgi:hypothetical protein
MLPVLFVECNFVSGPVNIWTGLGQTTWNGKTWIGMGSLLSISTIEEGADVQARGISLTLSGIDLELLQDTLNEFQVGLPVTIWLGLRDPQTNNLIPDPVVSFLGRTDEPTIDIDGKKASITVACESRLMDMNTPVPYRYTQVDQQLFYPGDQGFMWVNSIQSIPIYWGQTNTTDGNP